MEPKKSDLVAAGVHRQTTVRGINIGVGVVGPKNSGCADRYRGQISTWKERRLHIFVASTAAFTA